MTKNFNNAMKKLFTMVKDLCGVEDIRDDIYDWFWNSDTEKFVFNEEGMFYLLYDICNYDLITLNPTTISKRHSNHTDIAELLTPFASEENIVKVRERLYK